MKRKILWLVVSGLMVLSLLAASCAPAVEEAAPAAPAEGAAPAEEVAPVVEEKPAAPSAEMVKLTLTKRDGTKIEKMVEKPRYGGIVSYYGTAAIVGFDPVLVLNHRTGGTAHQTMDTLFIGDFARSSAGTDETNFWSTRWAPPWAYVPMLAESFEMPDTNTIIYHIRKGCYFQNKPPYGSWSGREMTADDVVFCINRQLESKTSPAALDVRHDFWPVSVNATDKWTVVLKSAPDIHILQVHTWVQSQIVINPRDFIEKYKSMVDWHNVIGTGPFILVDYVPGSVATSIRNPDYWRKDPLFPENQLPYVDKIEYYIIPDKSTYIAAMRTGKIDRSSSSGLATYDDLEGLLKTRPDIKYTTILSYTSPNVLYMWYNKLGEPTNDIRVRKALSMAIDRKAIVNQFYRGYASMLAYPVPPYKEHSDLYIPLEQLPESIQEILSYNPEKAKQLLAEAGYPKGFKTSVDVSAGSTMYVDLMTILKEHFAAIGVDMEIRPRESGVFTSMEQGHKQEHMIWVYTGATDPLSFMDVTFAGAAPKIANRGEINDPYLQDMEMQIAALIYDYDAQCKLYKEKVYCYLLEKVYSLNIPQYCPFVVRQPWLRNNDGGEYSFGCARYDSWPAYVWIDQELKKAMGY